MVGPASTYSGRLNNRACHGTSSQTSGEGSSGIRPRHCPDRPQLCAVLPAPARPPELDGKHGEDKVPRPERTPPGQAGADARRERGGSEAPFAPAVFIQEVNRPGGICLSVV